MQLRTKRVSWGNISITVREENGLDTFREPHLFWEVVRAIYGKELDYADIPPMERTKLNRIVPMINRTIEIEGDLGFVWPNANADVSGFKCAYEQIDNLAGGLVRIWHDAIETLMQAPMGDPELAPPNSVDETKKKSKSAAKA